LTLTSFGQIIGNDQIKLFLKK